MTDKDRSQDEMIRQNAEHIRRNEEAILRQTAALEKIRDHYFPHKTPWKVTVGWFLKVVGAITLATGIMESFEWYLNFRKSNAMAEESARVAKRLFFDEGDADGALHFLEKAVELDDSTVRYRIALTYVRGIVVLADLLNLERPLTSEERARNDAILSEAIFLQEVSTDEPMPYVLAAQALFLRGERERAQTMLGKALALAPDNAFVHLHACCLYFLEGNAATAQRELATVARLKPDLPIIHYWKGILAFEKDASTARRHFEEFLRKRPNHALGKTDLALALMKEAKPDFAAVRKLLEGALTTNPNLARPRIIMSETYAREGNLPVARLWLTDVLTQYPTCMYALLARARLDKRLNASPIADLTAAINLAPFRADLYDLRAQAYAACNDAARAQADRAMAKALSSVSTANTATTK